uniref:Uncharacterized protein n=1 Tax=Geoglobus ahangari TaxID=113653 RepID=A0A7C4WD99_9EURY
MRYVEEMESGLIVHLSASTYLSRDTLSKKVITSVEKTIELGADWVNVHINVGSKNDIEQIKEVLRVAEIFDSYGIPLLVMSYPRGAGMNSVLKRLSLQSESQTNWVPTRSWLREGSKDRTSLK